jgi:hypothetical protein
MCNWKYYIYNPVDIWNDFCKLNIKEYTLKVCCCFFLLIKGFVIRLTRRIPLPLGSNIYHMYILNYLVTIAYCIVTLKLGRVQIVSIYFIHKTAYHFYMPSRQPYLMWLGMACRRPHNNFNSVYRIFTKLDHMIALWKGKNPQIRF